jgi:hypothetical protein
MRSNRVSAVVVFTLTLFLFLLIPANSILSLVSGKLLISSDKTNSSRTPGITSTSSRANNNGTITIHTINTIQTNGLNLTAEEAAVKRTILGNIDNAIFITKGSAKSTIPVSVNARIVNQLANNRTTTTQGGAITKQSLTTELVTALNATLPSGDITSKNVQKSGKVAVDTQASCKGIASPTTAACTFIISIDR